MNREDYVKYAPAFGMKPEFYDFTADNTNVPEKEFEKCQKVLNWDTSSAKGFYLYGRTGNGKSHFLKVKANSLVVKKIDGIVNRFYSEKYPQWIEHTEYLKDLMPNGSFDRERAHRIERYVDEVKNADWLFIDDFGATTKSEWSINETFKLIDARVASKKQTFVSSNLDPNEILHHFGERIQSRMFELCTFIKFEGIDRRKLL